MSFLFSEYVARHVGLVHYKLDELMQDQELVKRKMKVGDKIKWHKNQDFV